MTDREFSYKIYDIDGTGEARLNDNIFVSTPIFSQTLANGFTQCKLDLSQRFDDLDPAIEGMKFIKIFEANPDDIDGRLIYSGFIETIDVSMKSRRSFIILTPLQSVLSKDILKDGGDLEIVYATQNPADIERAIIDEFQTDNSTTYGGLITYTGASIVDPTVGDIAPTFTKKTYDFAMKSVLKDTDDADYFLRVDPDGVVYYLATPSTPTHTFNFQLHVNDGNVSEDYLNIRNQVYLDNNIVVNSVNDATSISTYGRRSKVITDSRYSLQDEIDARMNQELVVPAVGQTLIINNNYTGAIKVGETCSVLDLPIDSRGLEENMLITRIDYNKTTRTLSLQKINKDPVERLTKYLDNREGV